MNISLDIYRPSQLRLMAAFITQLAADQEACEASLVETPIGSDHHGAPTFVGNVPSRVAGFSAPTPPPVVSEPQILDDENAASSGPVPARDSDGLPWDERIHSAKPTITGSGTWRRRKNLDDATYNTVRAQLMATGASAGAATVSPAPAVAPPVLTPAPAPILPPAASVQPIPPIPAPQPVAPVVAPPTLPTFPGMAPALAPVAPSLTFPEVMVSFKACTDLGYTIEQMNQVANEHGKPVFALLASAPDTWVGVKARLDGLVASTQSR